MRIAGIATGAIGLAGLAIGITLAVEGRDEGIAKIGFIGGGVATAAGVGLYLFGRSRVETVTVTPAPGGATVSAGFRF